MTLEECGLREELRILPLLLLLPPPPLPFPSWPQETSAGGKITWRSRWRRLPRAAALEAQESLRARAGRTLTSQLHLAVSLEVEGSVHLLAALPLNQFRVLLAVLAVVVSSGEGRSDCKFVMQHYETRLTIANGWVDGDLPSIRQAAPRVTSTSHSYLNPRSLP